MGQLFDHCLEQNRESLAAVKEAVKQMTAKSSLSVFDRVSALLNEINHSRKETKVAYIVAFRGYMPPNMNCYWERWMMQDGCLGFGLTSNPATAVEFSSAEVALSCGEKFVREMKDAKVFCSYIQAEVVEIRKDGPTPLSKVDPLARGSWELDMPAPQQPTEKIDQCELGGAPAPVECEVEGERLLPPDSDNPVVEDRPATMYAAMYVLTFCGIPIQRLYLADFNGEHSFCDAELCGDANLYPSAEEARVAAQRRWPQYFLDKVGGPNSLFYNAWIKTIPVDPTKEKEPVNEYVIAYYKYLFGVIPWETLYLMGNGSYTTNINKARYHYSFKAAQEEAVSWIPPKCKSCFSLIRSIQNPV